MRTSSSGEKLLRLRVSCERFFFKKVFESLIGIFNEFFWRDNEENSVGEEKRINVAIKGNTYNLNIFDRFLNFMKLVRISAWIMRFKLNTQGETVNRIFEFRRTSKRDNRVIVLVQGEYFNLHQPEKTG